MDELMYNLATWSDLSVTLIHGHYKYLFYLREENPLDARKCVIYY